MKIQESFEMFFLIQAPGFFLSFDEAGLQGIEFKELFFCPAVTGTIYTPWE
ncbi:MAG: hypothetical protein Q8S57_06175 [Methanoregula sp.]|nr:hypothetical protein [Methanoregula sp.]